MEQLPSIKQAAACPVWVPGCTEPPPPFFPLKMQDFASFFEKFPGEAPGTPPPLEGTGARACQVPMYYYRWSDHVTKFATMCCFSTFSAAICPDHASCVFHSIVRFRSFSSSTHASCITLFLPIQEAVLVFLT